ncbi:hypothetical protein G6F46_012984 [Rhizopus delemar]|nr:hypothetical protein G6F46_012984 [Rhizopus delemar]
MSARTATVAGATIGQAVDGGADLLGVAVGDEATHADLRTPHRRAGGVGLADHHARHFIERVVDTAHHRLPVQRLRAYRGLGVAGGLADHLHLVQRTGVAAARFGRLALRCFGQGVQCGGDQQGKQRNTGKARNRSHRNRTCKGGKPRSVGSANDIGMTWPRNYDGTVGPVTAFGYARRFNGAEVLAMRKRSKIWLGGAALVLLAACNRAPSGEQAGAQPPPTAGENAAPEAAPPASSAAADGAALTDRDGKPVPLVPFDTGSVPLSAAALGELPFFSLPQGYAPQNAPHPRAWARFPFRMGEGVHWVEGPSWSARIVADSEAAPDKAFSALEVQRNVDGVITAAGGRKVWKARSVAASSMR